MSPRAATPKHPSERRRENPLAGQFADQDDDDSDSDGDGGGGVEIRRQPSVREMAPNMFDGFDGVRARLKVPHPLNPQPPSTPRLYPTHRKQHPSHRYNRTPSAHH